MTRNRYFKVKLHSACVVTKNAYGMPKGRWLILCKNTEMKMYTVKYVVMTCVILQSLHS